MFTKKEIWRLLIPLIVEQLLNALMGSMDTMMVSNVGAAAISAVSLVDSVNVMAILVFSAMATGGSIICSQYIGRGQREEAVNVGEQLILTVVFLATAAMLIFIVLRRPMLSLIFGRIEQDVMDCALMYLWITALSYPFMALYNAGAALFRASGNSRLPMLVSTVANIINVAGNALLIFGFGFGVAGAAAATLFSRICSALAIVWFLRKPGQTIVIQHYLSIRPQFPVIFRIMSIGIPTGIENGMFQFGKLVIQSTVSTMGTIAIAAQAMTAMLEQITSNAAIGIGLGMMTVVGQCMGAGKVEEAKKHIVRLSLYGEASIVISCLTAALLVKPITVFGGMDPAAAQMTVQLTWLICIYKSIMWTFSFMPSYGMRAAGDVRFSMLVSSITMWLCRVVVTVVLVRVWGFGPLAVWIGMFSDWTVRGIVFMIRYRSGKWAEKKVIAS